MSVLLLSVGYEPLNVLPTRRAVTLVLEGKAEVVEEADEWYGSPSCKLLRPSVIRLQYSINAPYRSRTPLNRRAVMVRDRGICAYCKKQSLANTMDHVIPRGKGGPHRWENVVCCCRSCNSKKADHTLEEMGWKLDFKPYAPSGTHWLVLKMNHVDPAWDKWLGYQASEVNSA